jgi:hypothetical protein
MKTNLIALIAVSRGTLEEKSAVRYVVGMIMGSIKDIAKDIPASLMLVVVHQAKMHVAIRLTTV